MSSLLPGKEKSTVLLKQGLGPKRGSLPCDVQVETCLQASSSQPGQVMRVGHLAGHFEGPRGRARARSGSGTVPGLGRRWPPPPPPRGPGRAPGRRGLAQWQQRPGGRRARGVFLQAAPGRAERCSHRPWDAGGPGARGTASEAWGALRSRRSPLPALVCRCNRRGRRRLRQPRRRPLRFCAQAAPKPVILQKHSLLNTPHTLARTQTHTHT